MSSKEVYDSIVDVSNDYLSFVFDHGYYMNPSYYRKNGEPDFGFRFFITSDNYKKFKDLKWDLIPFYEYLLTNYNVGFDAKMLYNKGIRYSTLQLNRSPYNNRYMPILVNLDKKDLINKDLSEYDEYYLSCISFYIKVNNEI